MKFGSGWACAGWGRMKKRCEYKVCFFPGVETLKILPKILWLALSFTYLLLTTPLATAADESDAVTTRPKIGLVLGGGGARGAAHVGVLKVLEDMNIPVDYVVGTSMGSIVGGLYASGMTPEEIESEMQSMDWNDMFKDSPERADRTFRRKRDDDLNTIKVKPGLKKSGLQVPLAYIRGQKLGLELARLTLSAAGIKDYDQLSIPYRAVAADLETGKEVVMRSGDIAKSIRASMAVPGAFDPVEIDGKILVDGGIANNVPVSVAHAMGAEVVIVVDVGSGLYKRDELKDVVDVTVQLTNFLFTLNTQHQLALLKERDVLIKPELGDIGGGSFDRVPEAMPIGEVAARAKAQKLSRYSLKPEAYARHIANRGQRDHSLPVVSFVRIANQSQVSDDLIAKRISAKIGQPLDEIALKKDIGSIYGLEIFQTVTYEVVEEGGKKGLLVSAKEKWWGPGYIQGGVNYANDLGENSIFNISALYTRTQINQLNGEWRLGVQLGDEPRIGGDIYQPLDPLNKYFVAGSLGYATRLMGQFDDNGNRLARLKLSSLNYELATGINFGNWGEARVGLVGQNGTGEVNIGAKMPDFDFNTGFTYIRLTDDKLDSLYFPRKGHAGRAELRISRKEFGAGAEFEQLLLSYNHATSWSRNTLIGGLVLNATLDDDSPIQSQFTNGGFLRLSGLSERQLTGQNAGLARLIYMRNIKESQIVAGYMGVSLEAGNVWQKKSDISLSDLIFGASAFLGFDTPIGPLYLGYGITDHGDSSVYINLGPLIRN